MYIFGRMAQTPYNCLLEKDKTMISCQTKKSITYLNSAIRNTNKIRQFYLCDLYNLEFYTSVLLVLPTINLTGALSIFLRAFAILIAYFFSYVRDIINT